MTIPIIMRFKKLFGLRLSVFVFLAVTGCSEKRAFVKVSDVNPRYLDSGNGATFIPIGPNICFARLVTEGDSLLSYYDYYFQKLADNNGNFTRIWLSVPLLEIEQQQAGVYDGKTLELIDALVELGEKHGIYIKFCLEHFRKITGAPAPFPSSVPFDKPVYQDRVASMQDYFSGETGRQLFLARASFLAKRYAGRPHVFGWELWNEVNAVSGVNGQLLLDWSTDMLRELKQVAPHQLVMQTLGSYDSESQHERYKAYSKLDGNQIAQAHRYLDMGAALKVCQAPMDELAADVVRNLLEFGPGKPVILSEVGAVEPHHAGPSRLYENDSLGVLLHDLLFSPFFSGAAGPGQGWHWDYYIEKHDLWWHFKRFSEAVKGFDPISESAVPFYNVTDDGLKVYGLKGKTTSLIWIRDSASNWQTELVDGVFPEKSKGRIISSGFTESKSITFYDPWEGTETTGIPDEILKLPEFKRSLVVRIKH